MKQWTAVLAVFAASCATLTPSAPAFTLDFTFTGSVPADLRNAVTYAGGLWSSWLLDTNTAENEDIEITVDYKDLGAGVLGEAGPTRVWYDNNYLYLPATAAVLYGAGDTDNEDGIINFSNNSRFDWYTATDGNPAGGQYDAVTVALHEIGHQVGFYPTYEMSKDNTWGYNIIGNQYRLTKWDTLLRDASGHAPAAGQVNDAFNETGNPIYFTGSEAVAEYGGNIPIYAPADYAPGSSLSHVDEQPPFESYLMSYSLNTGEAIHSLSAVEVAMLRDLGWNAVPEPASAVLLAFGAAVLSRRRRKTA